MYDEIMVCLDGSLFAEQILPYAKGMAGSMRVRLRLLRVIENDAEFPAAKSYLEPIAKSVGAEGKVKVAQEGVTATILRELSQRPSSLPAMTTHGRTGLSEALLGSVAQSVIRRVGRPVFLFRPRRSAIPFRPEMEVKITSVAVPLDGSDFSEKILPFAVKMARSLKAELELVQVFQGPSGKNRVPNELARDIMECSYLRWQARKIKKEYGLSVDWDVLHGEPAEAVSDHVKDKKDRLLAMTSHARPALQRAIFGSVANECVRQAGVPILIYWADESNSTEEKAGNSASCAGYERTDSCQIVTKI